MNVEHCNAVIVVFAMHGCPACEDYKPRLEREVTRWQADGWPFVIAHDGQVFSRRQIPVLFINAASPHFQTAADQMDVQGVPLTILYRRGYMPHRVEGALDDQQIYDLLREAASA